MDREECVCVIKDAKRLDVPRAEEGVVKKFCMIFKINIGCLIRQYNPSNFYNRDVK